MTKSEENCLHKTSVGNIHESRDTAEQQAGRARKRGRWHMIAYSCPHCGFWHIGRKAKDKRKANKE